MTQRTRYFLVGSGLIVVVGLCTGLVAYYSGELANRRGAPMSELAYVPPTVTALAYADVRHIMDSEFHQRVRSMMPSGEEKQRLLTETGIDLERDIDTLVAGLSPGEAGVGPVVLVRGRFNESTIESVAVQHGATVEEFHGRRLLRVSHPGTAGEPGVGFLEPGLIALGQMDAIKKAIERSERSETIAANPEIMKVVNDVRDEGDAWLVGRLDAMSGDARLPGAVRDQLAGVQWFSLSAGIDRAMTCRVRAEARDEQAGEALRDVVNGALAVAKIMAGNDPRLGDLLGSMQARNTGSAVELSFTVPAEALEALRSGHVPSAGVGAIR